ncbi:MAG TPA: hypothetical protein VIJ87_19920, partial [Pyrinomonadaceae bacterium]
SEGDRGQGTRPGQLRGGDMPWMSINEWKKRNGIGRLAPKKKEKEPAPSKKKKAVFKLLGYDTFSNEWYNLEEFSTEKKAREAGIKRLEELAISQPASSSGGQTSGGIQDRVFIEFPDGNRYRVIG